MNITDQLSMVNDADTAAAAFQIVDTLQNHAPGVQVAAAGYLFLAMCDHFKKDPRDVLAMAARRTVDTDKREREHYRALKAYMKGEL